MGSGGAYRVGWYRFRSTFSRRRGGYLALVALVGLLGGLAMASTAASRRTASAFPQFLASTNPSDFTMTIFGGTSTSFAAYSPNLTEQIAAIPGVRRVVALGDFRAAPLGADGSPVFSQAGNVLSVGSIGGDLFDQDRVAIVQGRRANPSNPNELMMTAEAARLLGLRLGQEVTYAVLTSPDPAAAPVVLHLRLVGLMVLADGVVEDDVDALPTFSVFTPALTRQLRSSASNSTPEASWRPSSRRRSASCPPATSTRCTSRRRSRRKPSTPSSPSGSPWGSSERSPRWPAC